MERGIVLQQVFPRSRHRHRLRRAFYLQGNADVDGNDGPNIHVLCVRSKTRPPNGEVIRIKGNVWDGELSRVVGAGGSLKMADRVLNFHLCVGYHGPRQLNPGPRYYTRASAP